MRNIAVCLFLLGLLSTCTNSPSPTSDTNSSSPKSETRSLKTPEVNVLPVQNLRGMYKSDAQGAFFYDCSTEQTYRISTKPAGLDSMYREACQPAPYPGEPVYAIIQGKITKSGQQDLLLITQVDTLAPRTMFNNCQPYEFWCIGTEPFWGMVISKAESCISLKQLGQDSGKAFPWSAPAKAGETLVYQSTHPKTGEQLIVRLQPERCTDGMSDRVYNYAVTVQLGQQTLRGCALQ